MDQESLTMHNKIQQWGQMYTLGADGTVNKNAKLIAYLPAHKLEQIERWRKDVKRNTKKSKSIKEHHNWSYSAVPKTEKRIISADGSLRKIPQVNGMRVTSANNMKPYNRTDLFSVTNHLTETSLHYTAQREKLHKENCLNIRSIQIHNREQSLNGAVPDDIGDNITTQVNGEISENKDITSHKSSHNDLTFDKDLTLDIKSDKVDTEDTLSSISDMASRGHTIRVKDQTMVSARSTSNQLLNIISIDDCKRTGRIKLRNKESPTVNYETTGPVHNNDGEKKIILNGHDSKLSKVSSDSDRKTRADTRASRSHFDGTNMTTKSGFSDKHHKARITNAIDHIINDRKVMNDMDRNFDVRIESVTGRLVLDRPQESRRFRKMNTALRHHIDNIINDQGRRMTKKHYGHENGTFVAGAHGMNKLTQKITHLADSLSKGETINDDDDHGLNTLREKLSSLAKSVEKQELQREPQHSDRTYEKRDSLTNSATLPPMSEMHDLESLYAKTESPTDLHNKYAVDNNGIEGQNVQDNLQQKSEQNDSIEEDEDRWVTAGL